MEAGEIFPSSPSSPPFPLTSSPPACVSSVLPAVVQSEAASSSIVPPSPLALDASLFGLWCPEGDRLQLRCPLPDTRQDFPLAPRVPSCRCHGGVQALRPLIVCVVRRIAPVHFLLLFLPRSLQLLFALPLGLGRRPSLLPCGCWASLGPRSSWGRCPCRGRAASFGAAGLCLLLVYASTIHPGGGVWHAQPFPADSPSSLLLL